MKVFHANYVKESVFVVLLCILIASVFCLIGCEDDTPPVFNGDQDITDTTDQDKDNDSDLNTELSDLDILDSDVVEEEDVMEDGDIDQDDAPIACTPPLLACGEECVNIDENPDHCGDCFYECEVSEICFRGICKCPNGQMKCKGHCIDVMNDSTNCGGCGLENETPQEGFVCGSASNPCPKLVCDNGACARKICNSGFELCCEEEGYGGECVDLNNDNNNCGKCDKMCSAPKSCKLGNCECPDNLAECPAIGGGESVCVDLTSNISHCGACTTGEENNQCRNLDEFCNNGKCACKAATPDSCPADAERSDYCTDFDSDSDNCGGCDIECPLDSLGRETVCSNGLCTSTVCDQNGYASCDGECVNIYNDEMNCGGCNKQCGTDQECAEGLCVCKDDPAMTTLLVCGSGILSFCANPYTDDDNCGSCNHPCPWDQHCEGGQCVCNGNDMGDGNYSNEGYIICGQWPNTVCYDGNNDNNNCGACGQYCPGGQFCQESRCACLDETLTSCGEWPNLHCYNTQTDFNHCGECNHQCFEFSYCVDGVCQCDSEGQNPDYCSQGEGEGPICTNLSRDRNNCGECGIKCAQNTPFCVNGFCDIICEDPAFPNSCHVGDEAYCTNLSSSNSDCGSCGHVCPPGTHCGVDDESEIACVCDVYGQEYCAGTGCVDLLYSNDHCGVCNNQCGTNKHCEPGEEGGGVCVCDWPYTECNGLCVDLQTSQQHCGECGHPCTYGQICNYGICECPVDRPDKCGEYPNDICVDFMSDERNCGNCGENGDEYICKMDQTCNYGVCGCTQVGYTDCWEYDGGSCVDVNQNKQHCGDCGHYCPGSNQSCRDGSCYCLNNLTMCGEWPDTTCHNIENDNSNCGECGRACNTDAGAGSMKCTAGQCVCRTLNWYDCQNDDVEECFNIASDPEHCGQDCIDCPSNQVCISGQCDCATSYHLCGDTCYSDNDGSHCSTGFGSCIDCNSQHRTCNNGSGCGGCLSGYHECGNACYPENDPDHCGPNCENCGYRQECRGGSCECSSSRYLDCDNNNSNGCEVDKYTDADNCNRCNNPCEGNKICSNGNCICPSGTTWCDGHCVDTNADEANCGSCGHDCGSNSYCNNGSCKCNSNYGDCNGNGTGDDYNGCETYLRNNDSNCGACGTSCGSRSSCSGTSCQCDYTTYGNCNNNWSDGCETDLRQDDYNCGECNNPCGNHSHCSQYDCVCDTGWGDCNNRTSDGCEKNVSSDDDNCGSCGNECLPGYSCSSSQCLSNTWMSNPYWWAAGSSCGGTNHFCYNETATFCVQTLGNVGNRVYFEVWEDDLSSNDLMMSGSTAVLASHWYTSTGTYVTCMTWNVRCANGYSIGEGGALEFFVTAEVGNSGEKNSGTMYIDTDYCQDI